MTTDVRLNTDRGYFDFDWTADGDIDTESSLDTAILMSIFEEQRATASEVPASEARRGWPGNEFGNIEQGSKVWQFAQERVTGSMLAELGTVISNALQWLIDDDIVVSVDVEQPTVADGRVVVYINLGRDGSTVDRRYYELWDLTGSGLNF